MLGDAWGSFHISEISGAAFQMSEYNEYRARAAELQQKAKGAAGEDEKQSWLALADSWLQTAELQESLRRQERGTGAVAA
jgi:hypothetical protein